jgi:hypothetical protein
LCGWVVVEDGGRTPGGTALGGDSELRNMVTTATMTNKTTPAMLSAATQARIRRRFRRAAFVVMFSC